MNTLDLAYAEVEKLEEIFGGDDDSVAELSYDIDQAADDLRYVISKARRIIKEHQS